MIRDIVKDSDILKWPSFDSPVDSNSLCIAKDLEDTIKHGWRQGSTAVSLSANQIGERERVIAVADGIGKEIIVMFNPQIASKREEQTYWEENFCRPNILYKTERAYNICVEYQIADGREVRVFYQGRLAALIQQEIDNLNGILPEERGLIDVEVRPHPPRDLKLGE